MEPQPVVVRGSGGQVRRVQRLKSGSAHCFQWVRGKTEKIWNSGTQEKKLAKKFATENNLMLSIERSMKGVKIWNSDPTNAKHQTRRPPLADSTFAFCASCGFLRRLLPSFPFFLSSTF
jgi:hypothetical protein